MYNRQLAIAGNILHVQVVSSAADMENGLSGRAFMAEDQGMLFEFSGPDTPEFWMKKMKFNLDLIWISDGKVLAITPNAPAPTSASSSLPIYVSPRTVDQVLEVNAGWSAAKHIKTGDEVRLIN
ncbi:MAG: DUF192 domain-containing protein [Patescibacteria group bacterium]|nr:DUF192 domain-containing protein [Patescibacteria group bacterium]